MRSCGGTGRRKSSSAPGATAPATTARAASSPTGGGSTSTTREQRPPRSPRPPASRDERATLGSHGLPRLLLRRGGGPADVAALMVGRDRELSRVTRLFDDALAGQGRLVLWTGESGIGKTRLGGELTAAAAATGVQGAWARAADRDSSPPYGLWRPVLDEPAIRGDAWGGSRPDLWSHVFGDAARPVLAESADAGRAHRFALFAEVRRRLAEAAGPAGLLLVFDDLQWADEASAALLTDLVRQLHGTRMLVFASYRASPGAGDETLLRLSAEANADRVDLHGPPAGLLRPRGPGRADRAGGPDARGRRRAGQRLGRDVGPAVADRHPVRDRSAAARSARAHRPRFLPGPAEQPGRAMALPGGRGHARAGHRTLRRRGAAGPRRVQAIQRHGAPGRDRRSLRDLVPVLPAHRTRPVRPGRDVRPHPCAPPAGGRGHHSGSRHHLPRAHPHADPPFPGRPGRRRNGLRAGGADPVLDSVAGDARGGLGTRAAGRH